MTRYSPKTGLPTTYQVGPFDTPHLMVQWGGKLPGGETWSCGFRMVKFGGSTAADATAKLAPVAAAINAFHGRVGTRISARATLSYVKVNAVGTDGKYLSDSTGEVLYPDTPGYFSATSVPAPPNQIALAVSLTTGYTRGPGHRGRFYLPLPICDIDGPTGLILADEAATVDTSCQTLLTAVNAGGAEVMSVMSRKAGHPAHRAVTGFDIGRVLDTQRRRRRSIPELYV